VALLQEKMACDLRHPMGLRHPVVQVAAQHAYFPQKSAKEPYN